MRSGTALVLRLLGPMIQVLCLVVLFWPGSRGLTVLGLPVEKVLYAGFGVGFVVWAAGVILYRLERRPPPL